MKLIGRTLMILLAAGLVCGAAYALAGNGPSGRPEGRSPGFEQQAGGAGGTNAGVPRRPEGPGERGSERGRSGMLGGVVEMLRSLLIVALVAALSLPIVRLFQRRRAGAERDSDSPTDEPTVV